MHSAAPLRKVGVVTFARQVCVIGDGSSPPQIIAGDRLNDKEYILNAAKKLKLTHLQQTIGKSYETLASTVDKLEESGPTALGPALLASVTLAAAGKPGSKVIICTDGLANVGVGNLDELETDEDYQRAQEFYEGVGMFAKESGVKVSVITIKGEYSKLEYLSPIADEVMRVTPEKLSEEFSNILSNPVIATHVRAKIFLQKCMEFRNEDTHSLSNDGSFLIRQLGNVTSVSEITFEYTLKEAKQLLKIPPFMDISNLKYLPFQVQIEYNTLDGMRCVRVINKIQETSQDKENLMKDANLKLLAVNAKANLAKKALSGEYRLSQAAAKLYIGGIQKSVKNKEDEAQFSALKNEVKKLYSNLQKEQMEEVEKYQGSEVSSKLRKKFRPDTIVEKGQKFHSW